MGEGEQKKRKRVAFIGTVGQGKTTFLPYLIGKLEINPPIAEAMYKCGYLSEAAAKKISVEWIQKRRKKVMKDLFGDIDASS